MRNADVRALLGTFKHHRILTRDLLFSLNSEQLSIKPISSAGTFGKQFRHILDIERCYVESIVNGSLNFLRPYIDHTLESDKESMKSFKTILSQIGDISSFHLMFSLFSVLSLILSAKWSIISENSSVKLVGPSSSGSGKFSKMLFD